VAEEFPELHLRILQSTGLLKSHGPGQPGRPLRRVQFRGPACFLQGLWESPKPFLSSCCQSTSLGQQRPGNRLSALISKRLFCRAKGPERRFVVCELNPHFSQRQQSLHIASFTCFHSHGF